MTLFYNLDSDNEDTPRNVNNKKERYFWQYNVQSKGPKGTRLVIKTQLEDPHVLNEVTDPVFSPNCSVRGIKVIKVHIRLPISNYPLKDYVFIFLFLLTPKIYKFVCSTVEKPEKETEMI